MSLDSGQIFIIFLCSLIISVLLIVFAVCCYSKNCYLNRLCCTPDDDNFRFFRSRPGDGMGSPLTEQDYAQMTNWSPDSPVILSGFDDRSSINSDTDASMTHNIGKMNTANGRANERSGLLKSTWRRGLVFYDSVRPRFNSLDSDDGSIISDITVSEPPSISALEFTFEWKAYMHQLKIVINRVILRRVTQFRPKQVQVKTQLLRIPDTSHDINVMDSYIKSQGRDEKKTVEQIVAHEVMTDITLRTAEESLNQIIQMNVGGQLTDYKLKFIVHEKSRWKNRSLFWEGELSLADVAESATVGLAVIIRPQAKEVKGQATVTVCYMPTAEKLCVTLVNCTELKASTFSPQAKDVFIKTTVVYRGKAIARWKSKSKPIQSGINFHETQSFDIPRDIIYEISVVANFVQSLPQVTPKFSPWILPKGDTEVLGRFVLSSTSNDAARQGWLDMVLHARTPITIKQQIQ